MNLMSAYGKAPPSQIHGNGYDSDRSFSEGTYAFPPPIYGQVSSHTSASSPSFPEAASMAQIPYSSSQPRASYEDPTGPYLSVGSTPTPVIKTYAPQRGTGGMKMQVAISTIYELLTSSEPVFSLSFGHTKVPASFTKTNQQGSICEYSVDAEIPQFAVTGWPTVSLPVSMYMESGDGDVIAKLDVGEFTYGDASSNNFQEPQRKRKYSNDSTDIESSAKRLASQQIRPKDDFTQYTSYAPNPSNYMAYPGTTTMPSTTYGAVPQYNRQGIYQPQRGMGTYANPGAASGMRTQPGSWGTSYPPLTSMRSPGVPSNSGLSRSLPSPGASANPPLVRTTCLQQTPSPANTPHGLVPQYNTYPLYPNRAQLEIEGDLDSMTCRWSAEEWEASRRLVLFTRSQSGSTITTKFKPVSADEKHHNGIVISCIMWPEKKECFVTSVEIISLLEVLVTGRFTVEEKNRIRRNLEGYRPLTVSKGKDDSASFFKTIMDFPLPKPRNIEKDIKVFYWKDLTVALKKIIGKYSASPSSILPPAPALLTPVSSTGYAADGSNSLSYDHQALSPRTIAAPSTAYMSTSNHVRMSPLDQKMPLQSSAHPHDPSQWQGHQMQNSQYLGNQGVRSWDLSSNYLENSGGTGGNLAQTQNLGYSHRNIDNSDGHGDNRRLSMSRSQSQQVSH